MRIKHRYSGIFRCLPPDMMARLKAKDWLLLFLLGISTLFTPSTGCPIPPDSPCLCEVNEDNQYVINCRYKPLQTIPTFTDPSIPVYELALYKCMIKDIPDNAFTNLTVERIDVDGNPLETISDLAFNGLENSLKQLVLSANNLDPGVEVPFPATALSRLTRLELLHVTKFHIPTLPSGALSPLVALRDLSITNSALQSLSASDFLNQRDSLQNLHLQSNTLSSFPGEALGVLNKLRKLDLTQNGIRGEIPANAFVNNAELEEIDLSNNAIHPIVDGAFNGITNTLKTFHMRSNLLTAYDLNKISTLSAVEDLDLSYNGDLNALENGVLGNMHNLYKLNLHGCNIARLMPDSFEGVKDSLVILQMADNRITSIQSGAFTGFVKLEDLYLDHMQTLGGVLDEDSFSGLESCLKELSLEQTAFSAQNWPAVKSLAQLTKLKLMNNEIETVPDFALQKLSKLETLDLSFNMINEITQRALLGPQNSLKTLKLGTNLLSTVSECAVNSFTQLEHIGLQNNPLHCDCHVKWLRVWVDENYNDIEKEILGWKCQTPAEHENKLFVDVSVEDLDKVCSGSTVTPVECEEFTTTTEPTTTSTRPATTTTTQGPRTTTTPGDNVPTTSPLIVNVTDVTSSTCDIAWFTERRGDIEHFEIDVTQGNTPVDTFEAGRNVRAFTLEKLHAATDYKVCVTMWISVAGVQDDEVGCVDFSTRSDPGSLVTEGSSMTTIIAVVCVVVILLLILFIVLFLVLKYRGKLPHVLAKWTEKKSKSSAMGTPSGGATGGHPSVGKDTKRFSKAKHTSQEIHNQNLANKNIEHFKRSNYDHSHKHVDLERDLQRFSPEERERILNMLTHSGGSHLSTISVGSQRYVPEPPPRHPAGFPMGSAGSYDQLARGPGYHEALGAEGYLEPQALDPEADGGYLEPHTYVEIDLDQPQISKECYI